MQDDYLFTSPLIEMHYFSKKMKVRDHVSKVP